ncbi:hypothetical protein M758_5G087000, partial [Ceratodon purpureus]
IDRYERYERAERAERAERVERYERGEERSERYERAEWSTGSRRDRGEAVRVPRRVVRNWERLVGAAVREDLEAASQSDWSSEEDDGEGDGDGEDDEGFDGMARRATKRYNSSKSYVVPQSLAAQTDIDAVMEAAEDIQKDDVEVARICTCLNEFLSLDSVFLVCFVCR